MAKGLGVKHVFVVANKVRNETDIEFLKEHMKDMDLIGFIKFNQSVMDADVRGGSPYEGTSGAVEEIREIKSKLQSMIA